MADPKQKGAPKPKDKADRPRKEAIPEGPVEKPGPPRLKTRYEAEVGPALRQEFSYPNRMAIPRVHKIVLNMGLGEAIQNPKAVDAATADLAQIAGQRPIVTKAKKSIATFKVRAGMNVGATVTLRGGRMWEFLDKLMNLALPRIRDFRGVNPKSFDGRGNYSLGIKEQLIFPEIDYDKVDRIRGMDITIVTTANTDEEARALLRHLGMPFRTAGAAVLAPASKEAL